MSDLWADSVLDEVALSHQIPSLGRLKDWRRSLESERDLVRALRAAPIPHEDDVDEVRAEHRSLPMPEAATGRFHETPPSASSSQGSAQAGVERALTRAGLSTDLNAFTAMFAAQATTDAVAVDERVADGEELPLAGLTFAVKDLIAVKGYATTAGISSLNAKPAEHDAPAVDRLRSAGAVLVGMTNLSALAYEALGTNSLAGPVLNPLAKERLTGGSSSGSAAAVSAGVVDFALGSDTGGSIRIPAALCGVVGLKPTFGRVPIACVHPVAPSLDHVGPIARTVDQVAVAFEALTGEPRPQAAARWKSLHGVRVGVPRQYALDFLDHDVQTAFQSALETAERLGAKIVPVDLPSMTYAPAAQLATISAEAFEYNRFLVTSTEADIPRDVRTRLELGMFRFAADYVRAQRIRAWMRADLDSALTKCHVLAWPTVAVVAPWRGAENVQLAELDWPVQAALTRLTVPYNLTGYPALSVPCGRDPFGAGIGLQLGGPPADEHALLAIGRVLEDALRS